LHEENWEFGHVAAETGRKTDTDAKITRKLVYHMGYGNQGKSTESSDGNKPVADLGLVDADDGHEAAARGTFLAVAEKEVGAAGGTEVADEDVGGEEASAEELGAIGFAEIEEDILGRGLVAGRHHVEPLDGIGFVTGTEFVEPIGGFGELGLELGGDFGADFVAAAAYGGADGGEEVGGVGFVLHLHFADSLYDDTRESAAPAGVNGGYGALFGVNEENRDAIGGLDAEEEAGAIGSGSVPLAKLGRWCIEEMDYVGMDLFQGDEIEVRCGEGGLETAAVLEYVFFGVPFGEAEIENLFAVLIRNAAGFGAEAVDEPGEFR